MTQTWKKIATVSLAAVMLTGSLAGCGKKAVSIDKENPSINVMTTEVLSLRRYQCHCIRR